MGIVFRKGLNSGDLGSAHSRYGHRTGANGFTIHIDRTGPTLRYTAPILCAGKTYHFANGPQQGHIRLYVHIMDLAIDV
jgi:hypothetical protein